MTDKLRQIILAAFMLLATSSASLAGSGSFIGVEGESVSGTAVISVDRVTLSKDFSSSRGPDLYVYLGNSRPTKIIAKLQKRRGAQSYKLPSGIELSKYSAVFIHCKRFNHTFGKAKFR